MPLKIKLKQTKQNCIKTSLSQQKDFLKHIFAEKHWIRQTGIRPIPDHEN